MTASPPPSEYDAKLGGVLASRDWDALRAFSREHNEIPDDVYEQGRHFWEVLMHKLICNRIDLLGLHDESKAWLHHHGYTTDLGGY